MIREVLAINLKILNYTPILSSMGNKAIEIYEKNQIDAVILDMIMPAMNGREVFLN